jgi:hypothetical protein
MHLRVLLAAAVLLLMHGVSISASAASQPEVRKLIRDAVAKFEKSLERQAEYAYVRERERRKLNSDGTVKSTDSAKVAHEWVEGHLILRTVEKDGRSLTPEEQRLQDREVRKILTELEKLSPQERRKRAREAHESNRKKFDFLREMHTAFDYTAQPSETIRGRETLVYSFEPRLGYEPSNMRAAVFRKTRGKIWLDKAEGEVVRLDAHVFEDVSLASFLAKLYKGTNFQFTRMRLGPGLWLSEREHMRFTGRVLLVKSFGEESDAVYRNYVYRPEPARRLQAALGR